MIRNIFRETILIRLLIAFSAGIISSFYFIKSDPCLLIIFPLIFAIVFAIHYYLSKKIKGFSFHLTNGLGIYLLFFVIGWLLNFASHEEFSSQHFSKCNSSYLWIKVEQSLTTNPNSNRYIGNVFSNDHNQKQQGKILLMCRTRKLEIGSIIKLYSNYQLISKNRNPGEFNSKNYWRKKSIFHQVFIKDVDSLIKIENLNFLSENSIKVVAYFESTLRNYIEDNNNYAVASALLIGSRNGIDKSTVKDYTETGTIHILSVSGLHVAIIFLVFDKFLSLFVWYKTKFLKTILLISFVWFYAYITGLSPSVCRSATMISFTIFGKQINKNSNIYNLIAGSALLLLLFEPNYLLDIGFQLSYLAVIGIIYFYDLIYDSVELKWKWLDTIWKLICVSIAAQISTLGLTLFYFQQFPNYFILANLLAIPLSTLALYLGIGLLLFSPIAFIAKYIGFLLSKIIFLISLVLHQITELPFAVSHFMPIKIWDIIFINLFILLFWNWAKSKNKLLLKLCLVAVMLICVSNCINTFFINKSNILILHSKKFPMLVLKNGIDLDIICQQTTNFKELNNIISQLKSKGWILRKVKYINQSCIIKCNQNSFGFCIKKSNSYDQFKGVAYLLGNFKAKELPNLSKQLPRTLFVSHQKFPNTFTSNALYSTYDQGFLSINEQAF